jgi:hypothetical protein
MKSGTPISRSEESEPDHFIVNFRRAVLIFIISLSRPLFESSRASCYEIEIQSTETIFGGG